MVPCFEDVDTLRLSGGKSDSPSDFFFFFQTFPAPRLALLASPGDGQRRERAPRGLGAGAVQGLGQRPGEGCTPCPSPRTALPKAEPRAPYGGRGAAAQPFPSRLSALLTEVPAGTETRIPPPGLGACGTGPPRVSPVPSAPCPRAGSRVVTVVSEEGRHPAAPLRAPQSAEGISPRLILPSGVGSRTGRPSALREAGKSCAQTLPFPRRQRAASLGVAHPGLAAHAS